MAAGSAVEVFVQLQVQWIQLLAHLVAALAIEGVQECPVPKA